MLRRLIPFLLLAAVVVACHGDDEATIEVTSTASPTPTATVVVTATPTATSTSGEDRGTGDAALDAIVRAVEERDVATLAALIEYQTLGCTFTQGMGGPPKCEPGQDEGDPVRVFPFSACEGGWTPTGTTTLGRFAHEVDGLWAALAVEEHPGTDGWPVPDTLLVFHSVQDGDGMDLARYLEVTDGRITHSGMVCAGTLQDLLDSPAFGLEVIAGPWDEPVERDTEAPSTGIASVDAILAAVASYDVGTLVEGMREAMRELSPVACVSVVQGPDEVECDTAKGEQPGDPVPLFPLAYCEGASVRDPLPALMAFLDQAPVLYAVVEAPSEPSPSPRYAHGAHWLVYELTGQDAQEGARLQVTEAGHVAAIWYGCGETPASLATFEGETLPVIANAR